MMTHLSVESLSDVTDGAEEELIAFFFNEDVHRAHRGEIEGGRELVPRNGCVRIRYFFSFFIFGGIFFFVRFDDSVSLVFAFVL